jgi:hypothetical protein
MTYFTYHSVGIDTAPHYKQHILSPDKFREVCYSLHELYVKFVYMNLFGQRGS